MVLGISTKILFVLQSSGHDCIARTVTIYLEHWTSSYAWLIQRPEIPKVSLKNSSIQKMRQFSRFTYNLLSNMFTVFIKQYIFGISVFMQFLDYWFTIPPDYSRTWSNIHIWGGFSSLKEFISFEYSEKSPHHSLLTCWQVWDRCIINICRYDLDVNERLSMSIGVSPVTKCRIQVLCIPCLV